MPRNKYPEETRQRILDAALKLFLEKGFEQTTVLDIVDNMGGLTRGAFYHHFKSKEEVLDSVAGQLYQVNNPFIKVRDMKGLSGLEKLKKAMLSRVAAGEREFGIGLEREEYLRLTKSMLELLRDPRFLQGQVMDNREASKMIEPIIAEGMADGSIRPGNAKILSELSILFFNFWLMPQIYPCTKEEAMDKILAIKEIFDGLGFYLIDQTAIDAFEHFAGVLDFYESS